VTFVKKELVVVGFEVGAVLLVSTGFNVVVTGLLLVVDVISTVDFVLVGLLVVVGILVNFRVEGCLVVVGIVVTIALVVGGAAAYTMYNYF